MGPEANIVEEEGIFYLWQPKALKQPFTSQIQVRCGEEQAANLNLTGEDDGVYAISNDVTERKYWEGPGSSVRFVYLLATSRASTVCL